MGTVADNARRSKRTPTNNGDTLPPHDPEAEAGTGKTRAWQILRGRGKGRAGEVDQDLGVGGRVSVKPRDIEDSPFCWQAKDGLKIIRESLDGAHAVASGLATYLALTEIASDEQSPEFLTTHSWIALKSGLGARIFWARLKDFERLKLIAVKDTAWKGPAKYTLLSFGNGCDTSRNGCGRSRKKRINPPLRGSEESKKNLRIITEGGARSRRRPLEDWQLSKDAARLQKQIDDERQRPKPDTELLSALVKQKKEIAAELKRRRPGAVEAKPVHKQEAPKVEAPQPQIPPNDREVTPEDWERAKREIFSQ
jgi:hypothetical protein